MEQLRTLGLYAAPTFGDGNFLFRALSDQPHDTPMHRAQLRRDVCAWIEAILQRRAQP
jgi:OTU domain-containing protein 3